MDVNSDMQQNGLQTYINDRPRDGEPFGFAPNQIDSVLYDAFGQRTVTTIFNPYNQYFVVMEVAPKYWQYPRCSTGSLFSTAAGNAVRHAADPGPGRHRQRSDALQRGLGRASAPHPKPTP